MNGPDRLKLLLAEGQTAVTGIDYLKVGSGQTELTVFFLKDPDAITPSLVNDLDVGDISIREIPTPAAELSEAQENAQLPIDGISWLAIGGQQVLQLQLCHPGGFMLYRLTITDPRLDPYYNSMVFSFKADCPTDLDCKPNDPNCILEERVDFAIDYGARDYDSFRRALLDFAAHRYPRWQDRIAADVGMMLTEVLSALGDEMAYYQDQIRRQAYLETASETRSLRRHARLVDTEISDGNSATTWLDISVVDGQEGSIPAGADVSAQSDGGKMIHYEVGNGLAETMSGGSYAVSAQLNSLDPHIWDEDDACLPRGATRLDIQWAHRARLTSSFYSIEGRVQPGRWLVLKTDPKDPSKTPRRHLVWVEEAGISEIADPLIKAPDSQSESQDQQPLTVTRIQWQESEATPFDIDLNELEIRGNIVPTTAGKTYPDGCDVPQARFVVGKDPDDPDMDLPVDQQATLDRAVEREGAAGHPAYLYSLPLSESTPVTWLKEVNEIAVPEVILKEVVWDGGSWQHVQHDEDTDWTVVRSFTGPPGSSKPGDRHVILDDGTWRRVVGYRRDGKTIIHHDYAANEGKTLRFGSGDLGRVPAAGTVFEVTYRLGNGLATQVAADTLTKFDVSELDFVKSVTNPFAAENARDPDSPMQIRLTAPEAYQQLTYRAVRPEDYAEAAERLDWVQKAACPFRWTGSWSTGIATADPYDAVILSSKRRQLLFDQLERFRLAGHDVAVVAPRYANLDLEIAICVDPSAYRGEVKAMVFSHLLDDGGFFDPDHFSFGDPLYRAQLEAAVQSISGVRAVDAIRIKRLGYFDWRPFDEAYYEIAADEIVRVENDPRYPTRGSVKLIAEGGA